MKLTQHFTLEELIFSEVGTRNQIDNTPPDNLSGNLLRLAKFLEDVRRVLERPIIVLSGYRCKQINDLVGSKDTSQHRIGCAADIKVAGLTPDDIVKLLIKSNIEYDQLIREFDSWVHISIPNKFADKPRKQVLIIDKAGSRNYS